MKSIIAFIVINLAFCGLAAAKKSLAEFEKAREIRILQSTREDIKRILAGYKLKSNYSEHSQTFSTENAHIEITYSNGESCSEEDSEAVWNISEWKVTWINISPRVGLKLEDIGIDSSDFQKEKKYANVDDTFVYHNKNLGIAFEVEEDEIETIFLFPTASNYGLLCDNETAEEYKAFFTNESFFTEPDLEKREYRIPGNPAPIIDKILLSKNEIIIGCISNSEQKSGCEDSTRKISIETITAYPENDGLTFNYTVSGGEIIGNGAKVVWDLSNAAPGTYTITVGVDDGCGICSPTKSQTVTVKECPNCAEEKPLTDAEKQASGGEKQLTDTKKP